MSNIPNAKEVGAFQRLYEKNPTAFFGVIFFLMFGLTYFININANSDAAQYYKELYEKERMRADGERNRNDKLTTEILITKGVIQKQEQVIIKADSTLKDNVGEKVSKMLNNEIK